VQLRDFLDNEGKGKLNVVAISWLEGQYGDPSEVRLQRRVREFHPDIRVIRANEQIQKDFAPLVFVPANFVFDGDGNRLFGDGTRHYLDKAALARLIEPHG
jgi:hypothetical protein